jgi:quercetin dioxygenase-like cupin family protein
MSGEVSARASVSKKIRNSDDHFDRSFALYANESQLRNQNERNKMNPLTQFKKIRILPLLIAPLVVSAALTAPPAGAAPTVTCPFGMPRTCGVNVTSLTFPYLGQFADIDTYAKIDEWKAKLKTTGVTDLHIVQVTIQPGGWLGWHSHPGFSLVVVKSGTATFYEADDPCTPITIPEGQTLFEPAGDVHMVRNEGAVPLVNLVIQLTPPGAPRADAAPDPGCFQLTCPYVSASN